MKAILSKRDLLWGFAAQGLSIGLWLVMLPVVLRYLPPPQVALWLVFITVASLAQLLELGFQPTLSRNVSYVYAGAQRLLSSGIQTVVTGPVSKNLLGQLLAASRLIYRAMAVLATLVLWIGGSAYVTSVMPDGQSKQGALWAWLCFSSGYIINFYYGYLNAFLQGRGDMLLSNKVVVVSRVVQLLAGMVLVICGFGLLGLAIASLMSSAVSRVMAHRFVFSGECKYLATCDAPRSQVLSLVKVLWHNAGRYGLVMVGAFLITRANILIASSRIGLVEAANFTLALQILIILQTVATLPFNLTLPRLNLLRAQGDKKGMRSIFGVTLVSALGIFGLASLAFVTAGEPTLMIIGSANALPRASILLLLSFVMLLELNHGICANLITTHNQVPFVKAAVLTGLGITLCAWIIAPKFGILGMITTMAAWQLSYNNWKWPLEASRVLGVSFDQLIIEGLIELKHRLSRTGVQ